MTTRDNRLFMDFQTLLAVLEALFMFGFVYVLMILVGLQNTVTIPREILIIYGVYFGAGTASLYAILNWKKWGVYLLVLSTLAIAVINIMRGTITLNAAAMGVAAGAIISVYIGRNWSRFS